MAEQQAFQPHISMTANICVTSLLFSAAMLAYGVRMFIRIRAMKRLMADDFILMFAVICLIAVTALGLAAMQEQYDWLAMIVGNDVELDLIESIQDIPKTSMKENAMSTMWWFVIFTVKMAFLFFFRRLVYRVHDLYIWWWCVLGFIVISGLACVAVSWLTCPYFDLTGAISCAGPSGVYRMMRDTGITAALDITTDILLVSIPLIILWRIRMRLRQKIGIGISLCLSIVMIVIVAARMACAKVNDDEVDIVWLAFWQQQECSIAVIIISVSAFRSFFATGTSAGSPPQHTLASQLRRLKMRGKFWSSGASSDRSDYDLPKIPGATLTGMRTCIERAGMTSIAPWLEEEEPDPIELEP